MTNYYEFLGIEQTATQEEIQAKCESTKKKFHRILETGSVKKRVQAEEDIKVLEEAMEILLNPENRKQYDASLNQTSKEEEPVKEKVADEEKPTPKYEESAKNTKKKRYKPVPVQVPDIPVENYEVDKPAFYFTNDVDELWKLYKQYKSNREEDNERFCFRKLMMMHYHDKRVQDALAEYNFAENQYKILGWASFIFIVLVFFGSLPQIFMR